MPVGCGGGGKEMEFGISRYKLSYTEWINSTVLQYSTGNYVQYPVINHNGKTHDVLIKWAEEHEFKIIDAGISGWRYAKNEVLIKNY